MIRVGTCHWHRAHSSQGLAIRTTTRLIRRIGGRREASGRRSGCFESWVALYLAVSTERLTPTGCRGRLDRVQHAMARDRVVERGAEMRSLAIVTGETRVRLGDVGGRARALRRRPPILLRHG